MNTTPEQRERMRTYYRDQGGRKAYFAKWRAENLAYRLAWNANWRAENPDAARRSSQVKSANAAARKLGLSGRIRIRDVSSLPQDCCYCGSIDDPTLDHATPLKRGGENHWANLTTACRPCNTRKSQRTVLEFIISRRVAA